jgi:hypothetical protein
MLFAFWILPLYCSFNIYTPSYGKSQKENWSNSALTLANVYDALIACEIAHPDVVMRQVIVETMWLKCKNCSKEVNNLFGFFLNGKYIEFDSWFESVIYYKQWQDSYYKGGDYYDFLNSIGYATSEKYERTLKQVILPEFNN